jgi:FkbM family methyltransferase
MLDIKKELWWQYNKRRWENLLSDVLTLDVEKVGLEDTIPYVKLKDFHTFYGNKTTKLDYFALKKVEKNANGFWEYRDWFGVLSDIITRFRYPQALPVSTKYLPRWNRQIYSRHLANSIWDIKGADTVKLTDTFMPKEDWVIFDCGAYLGYGAMSIASLVPNGLVVSWECSLVNISIIKKNLEINQIKNITLIPRAVWSIKGTQRLGKDESQSRSLVYGTEGNIVASDSIDNIVEELKLNKVDFISLTVNGAEPEALKGAESTIRRYSPCMSITGWVKREGTPVLNSCLKFLDSIDYKYAVTPDKRILAWKE